MPRNSTEGEPALEKLKSSRIAALLDALDALDEEQILSEARRFADIVRRNVIEIQRYEHNTNTVLSDEEKLNRIVQALAEHKFPTLDEKNRLEEAIIQIEKTYDENSEID